MKRLMTVLLALVCMFSVISAVSVNAASGVRTYYKNNGCDENSTTCKYRYQIKVTTESTKTSTDKKKTVQTLSNKDDKKQTKSCSTKAKETRDYKISDPSAPIPASVIAEDVKKTTGAAAKSSKDVCLSTSKNLEKNTYAKVYVQNQITEITYKYVVQPQVREGDTYVNDGPSATYYVTETITVPVLTY